MGLFSSIGKAIFGGSKKKSSSKATGTTDLDPYAPTIPYLNDYLADTSALYKNTPLFSDLERQGYDALRQTAGGGGGMDAAIAENNRVLSGEYLTPDTNPYLKDIATRVSGIAGANQNATFGGRGRSGSGLAGYYSGKAVGDSLTDMYGQVYESERGRMGAAVAAAPSLEAGRYLAPQALISAGQNISARPYDVNQQYGGILGSIAGLGQQGVSTGAQTNYKQSSGLVGKIANSFANKLFG